MTNPVNPSLFVSVVEKCNPKRAKVRHELDQIHSVWFQAESLEIVHINVLFLTFSPVERGHLKLTDLAAGVSFYWGLKFVVQNLIEAG